MEIFDAMFDNKIGKYILKKNGYPDIPVGLLQYGVDYLKVKDIDKKRATVLLKIINNEIDCFGLDKERAYKAIGIKNEKY
jgi:hypothetical protein